MRTFFLFILTFFDRIKGIKYTNQTVPYTRSMPYYLDSLIMEKDPVHKNKKESMNKTARNKKILFWLGVYRDRIQTGPYPFINDHSTEICYESGIIRDYQEKYQ